MGSTIQRANASTRGITSRIGAIDEDVFHQIKQRLKGSPDVSHSILKDGTIDPIGRNIFEYAASHPSFERVFSSSESQLAYEAWKTKNPAKFKAARAAADESAAGEEKQKGQSRARRGAGDKKQKGQGGLSKQDRRALKELRAEGFTELVFTSPEGTEYWGKPSNPEDPPFDFESL